MATTKLHLFEETIDCDKRHFAQKHELNSIVTPGPGWFVYADDPLGNIKRWLEGVYRDAEAWRMESMKAKADCHAKAPIDRSACLAYAIEGVEAVADFDAIGIFRRAQLHRALDILRKLASFYTAP